MKMLVESCSFSVLNSQGRERWIGHEIDIKEKEFNVLVHDNYAGDVYVTIPFYIIRGMYAEILKAEPLKDKPNG